MKTENDFRAQADRIISGLPKRLHPIVQEYRLLKLNRYLSQELLKAYNQGVQDEAQRIAEG